MNEFSLQAYDYNLPEELIAQYPGNERDQSRLMLVDKIGKLPPRHARMCELAQHLPANCLIIANNTKVVPCRLAARRPGGGKAEFLLLTPLPLIKARQNDNFKQAEVEGLLWPANKIRIGMTINIGQDMHLRVLEKKDFGNCRAELYWRGDLEDILHKIGALPLPPYIHRPAQTDDLSRYQTIYAQVSGSVAAPTAGLHFTPRLRQSLTKAGHEWQEITLHVGYGTFSPVRCEDIRDHKMHAEYVTISQTAANAISKAKKEHRPIIAVGTTSLRALEGAFRENNKICQFSGFINIFLYPGAAFNLVDGLITNFHLPKSTLLMLAAAFAGRENILAAYQQAVAEKYRFFSYGDAMLIA